MKLVVRDLVKKKGDMYILNGAGYTFHHGKIYGIEGNKEAKNTLLDCITYETDYNDGSIQLDCDGVDYLSPAMIVQMPEEPMFPEFLTVREFIKYFIDINKKYMTQINTVDEYLKIAELDKIAADRTIRDFTTEEKVRLQLLCFVISTPAVIIINGIKNISNVNFLKDIKKFFDILRKTSIIIIGSESRGMSMYLCDECLTIEDGYIRGGC